MGVGMGIGADAGAGAAGAAGSAGGEGDGGGAGVGGGGVEGADPSEVAALSLYDADSRTPELLWVCKCGRMDECLVYRLEVALGCGVYAA